MKRSTRNYLDYVPQKNPRCPWDRREDGCIAVVIPRRSVLDRLAQWLYFGAKETRVDLDCLGSFLWERMDGTRTVNELACLLRDHFGAQAEPLLPRLIQYLRMLRDHRLIFWTAPQ